MARPQRCRRICREPEYPGFTPDGVPCANTVVLSVDEFEALRLVDYEKMTHGQCAAQMDISRTTVTEIYESARYKVADSLVNGKRLVITGGTYRLCDGSASCGGPACPNDGPDLSLKILPKKEGTQMRIAVTYENGQVFQHFGHTQQFKFWAWTRSSTARWWIPPAAAMALWPASCGATRWMSSSAAALAPGRRTPWPRLASSSMAAFPAWQTRRWRP